MHSQPVTLVTAAKAVDGQGREMIASVDTAGIVKIWDVQTGEPVHLWSIGKIPNVDLVWQEVVCLHLDRDLTCANTSTHLNTHSQTPLSHTHVHTDSQHAWPLTGLGFTNSLKFFITTSKDGSIKRWDLQRVAEDRRASLIPAIPPVSRLLSICTLTWVRTSTCSVQRTR